MRIEGFCHGSDVILDKANWFRRHWTLSKVSIISLLSPAKHCDAVSGWVKEGFFCLQRMDNKAQPDGELIDSKVEASHMLNTC
jgi:hypothetical protein